MASSKLVSECCGERVGKTDYSATLLICGRATILTNAFWGTSLITGANADLELFFSLTPEQNPKVQMLTYKLKDKGQTV